MNMEKVLCQNSGSLLKDANGIIEQARQEPTVQSTLL